MMKYTTIGKIYNDLLSGDLSNVISYRVYTGNEYVIDRYTLNGGYLKHYLTNYLDRNFFYDSSAGALNTFKNKFNNYCINHLDNLDQVLTALFAKYNPVYNYDMQESEDSKHTPLYDDNGALIGGTTTQKSAITHKDVTFDNNDIIPGEANTDSVTTSGTVNHQVTTFDNSTYRNESQDGNSATSTSSTGDVMGAVITKTEDVSHNDNRTLTRFGNIGVTTSAQMVEQVTKLYKNSIEDIVMNSFLDLFTWEGCSIDWNGLE